jgi:hypothetical protein
VEVFSGERSKATILPKRSIVSALLEELQYPRNAEVRRAVLARGGLLEGKTQADLAAELGISLASLKRHKAGGMGNGKDTADFEWTRHGC